MDKLNDARERSDSSPTVNLEHHGDASSASTTFEKDVTGTASVPAGSKEGPSTDAVDANALVVDWDGPDDPNNPKNWSVRRKWTATVIVSAFAFVCPVSSSMIAPASNQVAAHFGVHNDVLIALTTSIFVLAFAFGPLLFGPLSEIYGRTRVLQLSNIWYLAWNIACGFAQNESQLLAFRFLAGLGGSAALAIGAGVLGDCWPPEKRGRAVALYLLAPLLGPVVGPITGAWVAERSTWKWVFWSTSIADGILLVLSFFIIQETFAPLLLKRKAESIRKSMDVEKAPHRQVRTIFDGKVDRSWRALVTKSLQRPFTMFTQEPIIQLLGIYMMYLYGTLYIFLTTMPTIFEGVYGQSIGIAGLHYIALGIGLTGASYLNARTLDKVYAHLKNKTDGVGKPEFRLPAMFFGTLVLPIGLLITGWTVEARVHWIVPDIGIVLVGAGIVLNWQCIQAYVVDAFTQYAASALAAITFLRSLAGCGFPLFAPAMYSALGYGKGDTVLAGVCVIIGCPALWIFWHYGERIRNASRRAR